MFLYHLLFKKKWCTVALQGSQQFTVCFLSSQIRLKISLWCPTQWLLLRSLPPPTQRKEHSQGFVILPLTKEVTYMSYFSPKNKFHMC